MALLYLFPEANDSPEQCADPPEVSTGGGESDGGSEEVNNACLNVTCDNGGTAEASGDVCECRCTSEWQGQTCRGTLYQSLLPLSGRGRRAEVRYNSPFYI